MSVLLSIYYENLQFEFGNKALHLGEGVLLVPFYRVFLLNEFGLTALFIYEKIAEMGLAPGMPGIPIYDKDADLFCSSSNAFAPCFE